MKWLIGNSKVTKIARRNFQENALENIACKMAAILSGPQYSETGTQYQGV